MSDVLRRTTPFKVIVIGNTGVGKSSLLERLHWGKFSHGHRPTLGPELFSHELVVNGETVKLKLFDTAGQERFNSLTYTYYRGADGVVGVFDVACQYSFDQLLSEWLPQAKQLCKEDAAFVLVGNKCDCTFSVNWKQIKEYSEGHLMELQLASAKTGENVEPIFHLLAKNMMDLQMACPDTPSILLHEHEHQKDFLDEAASSCCGSSYYYS